MLVFVAGDLPSSQGNIRDIHPKVSNPKTRGSIFITKKLVSLNKLTFFNKRIIAVLLKPPICKCTVL